MKQALSTVATYRSSSWPARKGRHGIWSCGAASEAVDGDASSGSDVLLDVVSLGACRSGGRERRGPWRLRRRRGGRPISAQLPRSKGERLLPMLSFWALSPLSVFREGTSHSFPTFLLSCPFRCS